MFKMRDMYNWRQCIRKVERNSYRSTAALIKRFDDTKVDYIIEWDKEDPNRLLGFAFAWEYNLAQWKRYLECMGIDNTYKTNR